MTEEAKAKKREYERKWRAKNPDKVRAIYQRYWEKKAAQEKNESGGAAENDGTENADHS